MPIYLNSLNLENYLSPGFFTLNNRWQLLMVTNQNKSRCKVQRTQAGGKQNLGCLINDANVKGTLAEDGMIDAKTGGSNHGLQHIILK